MKSLLARLPILVAWLTVTAVVHDASAQMDPGRTYVQAGVGAIPGVGFQGALVQTRALYTIEGAFYVDFTPRFVGGEGSVQVSGALGGAIRAFGIVRALGESSRYHSDLDIGFRLGPSLVFAMSESTRNENPFSLFLEPYGRFATEVTTDRTIFVELGLQRPILRAGLIFDL